MARFSQDRVMEAGSEDGIRLEDAGIGTVGGSDVVRRSWSGKVLGSIVDMYCISSNLTDVDLAVDSMNVGGRMVLMVEWLL